ncbi:glycosyltransferase family 2 protein [Providencia rettgeri]
MRIDVLISTFSDRLNTLKLPKERKNIQYIIIHQKYNDETVDVSNIKNRKDVIYIKTDTIGLTTSRNIALNASSAELKLIADDDLGFIDGFDKKIIDEYNQNKFDIGIFKIKTLDSNNEFRTYPNQAKWFGYVNCLHVCSVEMVISRDCNIRFNEEFGLGGKFICGEESIFLFDAKKQNKKIRFSPEYIVTHPLESTATKITDDVIKAKGAVYRYGFGRYLSLLFIFKLAFLSSFSKKFELKKIKLFKLLLAGWYEI